ncbi:hypothetical protein B0F90DRAFT_169696 [Multifurca ochricompacta]|uniref:Uncharacterized protein n=1 Tax=Multifurca ochricompacta TaxID=376703 RepID=A0AAD4M7P4_9AGAM|nr:hypothetical protein B0F90DRAFT_169696 [Multifurca ochricompacta]
MSFIISKFPTPTYHAEGATPDAILVDRKALYAQRASSFSLFRPLPSAATMTRRRTRRLQLHLIACFPLFLCPSFAQLLYPNCNAGWEWSYNSLNQNPCNVAAYLESTCEGGQFQIGSLPQGSLYRGPDTEQANLCQCNPVVYSLVSACGACQGSSWIQWSSWKFNCTTVASDSTFPKAIPNGTRVPHWAYLSVTISDTWNSTAAQISGDSPEGSPSSIPTGSSAPSTSSATSSSSSSSNSSSNENKSHAGQIAGSVVGGVVGAALLLGLILWYLRRRRWRSEARPSPFMSDAPHVAEAFGLQDPGTSTPNRKYYNPSDPSTFPVSLFSSSSVAVAQTSPNSDQAHRAATPTSPLERGRYNGLPLV